MKKNPEASKQLLEKALAELPNDNAMQTARFHIKRAINEVTKRVTQEAKKAQKPTPRQQWQLDLETGTMANPNLSPVVLKNLDSLIAQEQARIEAMKNKMATPAPKPPKLISGMMITG